MKMVNQLNVFSENRAGKLEKLTRILADAKVNIRAMKISSSDAYGVIKFLVDDPEKGFEAFRKAGVTASLKEVLAVEVPDKAGGMNDMLSLISKAGCNIEDAYGFVTSSGKTAAIVLELADVAVAQKALSGKYNIIGSSKLYNL